MHARRIVKRRKIERFRDRETQTQSGRDGTSTQEGEKEMAQENK